MDVPAQYDHVLTIALESGDQLGLETALGNLEGALLGVILGLEQQLEAQVRPSTMVQIQDGKAHLKLGLTFNQVTAPDTIKALVGELMKGFEDDNGVKLGVYFNE